MVVSSSLHLPGALLTDSGEATDGPLPLDHYVIAYWRMRSFGALLDALLDALLTRAGHYTVTATFAHRSAALGRIVPGSA